MANVTGRQTVNGIEILEVDADPSGAGGTVAPLGSLASVSDGSGLFIKDAAGDTAWTVFSEGTLTGSGATGQVSYWSSGTAISGDASFIWDPTNKRLGIESVTPSYPLHIEGAADNAAFIGVTPATPTSNDKYFYATGGVTGTLYPFYYEGAATSGAIARVLNTGTTASSHAILDLQCAATGGDPTVRLYSGVQYWSVGIDRSDSDTFRIARYFDVGGTNSYFTINTSGHGDFSNRLGVNQASPAYPLDVGGSGVSGIYAAVIPTTATSSDKLFYASTTITGTAYPFYFTGSATSGAFARIENTAVNALGHACLQLGTVSGGGDPYVRMYTGTSYWAMGVDNSDAEKFKISQSSAFAVNDRFVLLTDGTLGLGTSTPTYGQVELAYVAGGTNDGPVIALRNTSTTIANADQFGAIEFLSNDAALSGDGVYRASIWAESTDTGGDPLIKFGANVSPSAKSYTNTVSISNLGRVGVKTDTAYGLLDVWGTSTRGGDISLTRDDAALTDNEVFGEVAFRIENFATIPTYANKSRAIIRSYSISNGGNLGFMTAPTGDNPAVEVMTVRHDETVGIGVTDPAFQVEVQNNDASYGGAIALTHPTTYSSIASGTDLGTVLFGASGGESGRGALIRCASEAAWNATTSTNHAALYFMTQDGVRDTLNTKYGMKLNAYELSVRAEATFPRFHLVQDSVITSSEIWGRVGFETTDATDPGVGARIDVITTNSATNEAKMRIFAGTPSVQNEVMSFGATGTIVNSGGISTQDFQIDSDTASPIFFVDSSANKIGINVDAPEALFHVKSTQNAALTIERTTSSTSARVYGLRVQGTSSGSAAAGFGSGMSFAIKDNTDTINDVARISAEWDGADNTGLMKLDVVSAGTQLEKIRITGDRVSIHGNSTGTGSTDYPVEIVNTHSTSEDHGCLKLSIEEATTAGTDYFVRCYRNAGIGGTGTSTYYIDGVGGTGASLTVQHWTVYKTASEGHLTDEIEPGMIIESTGERGIHGGVETAIPVAQLCSTSKSKKVFGVLSSDWDNRDMFHWELFDGVFNDFSRREEMFEGGVYDPDNNDSASYSPTSRYFKARSNSGGEGKMWVTDIAGNIENGDYITSSEVPGYGALQDDDILHNYTVAKCTEDIDWPNIAETIDHNGTSYKKALIFCTYHCG